MQVSQLRYWLENGDYDSIVNESRKPDGTESIDSDGYAMCENPTLGLDLRISCHNMLGLAYSYKDDVELSDYHFKRLWELRDEKTRLFYEQN